MRNTLCKTRRKTRRKALRKALRKRHVTRKQSGGRIDMAKLGLVLNNRSRAANAATIAAKKAQALKDRLASF